MSGPERAFPTKNFMLNFLATQSRILGPKNSFQTWKILHVQNHPPKSGLGTHLAFICFPRQAALQLSNWAMNFNFICRSRRKSLLFQSFNINFWNAVAHSCFCYYLCCTRVPFLLFGVSLTSAWRLWRKTTQTT